MEEERKQRRNRWARRFPEIHRDWPYWWIEGDSYCLGVIDGGNLSAAVEIVEDCWDSYEVVKVYRAKVLDGDLIRRDARETVIFDRSGSAKSRARL